MSQQWNRMGKMSVFYDGHDLSDFLNVISLDRGIGVSRSNNLLKAGIQKGKNFSSYTYDEKQIPMGFSLVQSLVSKRRELAGILNVKEPKQLIFGDEPDKFYMAIPDGNIDLDETQGVGKGVINWVVPDGVAHSIEFSTFTPTTQNPDKINVVNRGTEACKPLLEAIMRSDNGLVAFIDNHGNILQFGDPESADGRDYKANEMIINESMRTQGNWKINQGLIRYRTMYDEGLIPNKIEGTYLFGQGSVKEDAVPSFSPNTGDCWNGPTLYQPIKPNSRGSNKGNFEMKSRFWFATGVYERTRYEFNIMNDNAEILPLSFVMRDSNYRGDEIIIEIWSYGKLLLSENLTNKKLKKDFFEIIISKFNNKVTFKLSEIAKLKGNNVTPGQVFTYSYTIPAIQNENFLGITLWNSQYRGQPAGSTAFTDFKYTWINVDKWEDVPNLFSMGDVIWADTENGKVYLNGIYRPDLDTFGNQWGNFRVEPNTQEYITVVESSWVPTESRPVYSAKIREVWV